MRLAFMGTPDFSVPVLAELIAAGHDIAAVYARAPAPSGRGHKLKPSPVHAFAEASGIEARTPANFKSQEEIDAFAALDLDAAIVVAYGMILPEAVLDAPRHGCLNLHASLLPRWRGAAPIQRAIMAGDKVTGVQVMQMEAGLGTPEMRRDARGGRGGFGQFFSLLGAYRIDRKTGIRAVIRPENIVNKGPLDRDIKTESIQFNEKFHISGRPLSPGNGHDIAQDVLRILTPATQAAMLDLETRFHNVGFIVDDDVLFFMAQDTLVGENASEGGIDRLLPGMLEEFEAAKLSIKRYVE